MGWGHGEALLKQVSKDEYGFWQRKVVSRKLLSHVCARGQQIVFAGTGVRAGRGNGKKNRGVEQIGGQALDALEAAF